MKKLRTSTAAKITAVLLLALCLITAIFSAIGVIYSAKSNFYRSDRFEDTAEMDNLQYSARYELEEEIEWAGAELFVSGSDAQETFMFAFESGECPLHIIIEDEHGDVVMRNFSLDEGVDFSQKNTEKYTLYYATINDEWGYFLDKGEYSKDFTFHRAIVHEDGWVKENALSYSQWLESEWGIDIIPVNEDVDKNLYRHISERGGYMVEHYDSYLYSEEGDLSFTQWLSDVRYIDPVDITSDDGSIVSAYLLQCEDFYGYDTTFVTSTQSLEENYHHYLPTEEVEVAPDGYYTVTTAFDESPALGSDLAARYHLMKLIFALRYVLIVLLVLSVIVGIALFVFLIAAAGWKKGFDTPQRGIMQKIPLGIYLLLCGFMALGFTLLGDIILSELYGEFGDIIGIAYIALHIIPVMGVIMSLVTRLKTGQWWRYTVCYLIYKFICRLPDIWAAVVIAFAYALLNIISLAMIIDGGGVAELGVIFFVMTNAAALALVILIAVHWSNIKKGALAIAGGDTDTRVDTRHMAGGIKAHAETINSIGAGVGLAVEKQMRSERMKTELITNVSHDIKTPITSIVNYVELLKEENIDNERVQRYIDVIERQSIRLKKLVSDLVEASKASTGNITPNLVRLNVTELLEQSLAEYRQRFSERSLEPIIATQSNLTALADGQL
ncbi:MAG: hypothetical protein IJC18_05370, partial [Clostridia bacterium]|nr:hypothetical protein [Clostridia bacterium]